MTWAADRRLLIGMITCSLVQGTLPAALALTARGLINAVAALLNNSVMDFSVILFWLALGLFLTFLDDISNTAIVFFKQRLNDEINLKVTSDILNHAASLDLSCFEDPDFQDIMERAQHGYIQNFSQYIIHILNAAMNFVQALSLIILLVAIEPIIAALLLPIVFPYLYYQWRLSKDRYRIEYSRITKRRWTNYFVMCLTNHRLVPDMKLLGLAPLLIDKFQSLMREFRDQDRRLYMRGCVINMIFACLSISAVYIALTQVAFRAAQGGLTIGDIAIYGTAASRLKSIIHGTIFSITKVLEQALYVSNLMVFYSIKPQIDIGQGENMHESRGEVEVRDVTFTYPGCEKPILNNLSLHIKSGETVALVGENGVGKTTLVKLISRFYDPDSGQVLFDGRDVREISYEHLRSHISYVSQDFGRYEASVSDNIAYGDWEKAMTNPACIEQTARLVDIHNTIEALPRGYDTLLGLRFGESTLSMGQWQKIALARAAIRDTSLLILDEPISNLDISSEYKLFSHFHELIKGKTTIMVSHRLSTIKLADRILLMDKGQIAEAGSHDELLEMGGKYAELFRLYMLQVPVKTEKG